jgi:hypothetical protein
VLCLLLVRVYTGVVIVSVVLLVPGRFLVCRRVWHDLRALSESGLAWELEFSARILGLNGSYGHTNYYPLWPQPAQLGRSGDGGE